MQINGEQCDKMSPVDLKDYIEKLAGLLVDKAEKEPSGETKKRYLASMALCGEQVFLPDYKPEAKDLKIAGVVHQIFTKYKTDELGQLTQEEVDRFRINFGRCVVGMEPKIAYDPEMCFKGTPYKASRIDVFLNIQQYCADNPEKALEEVGPDDRPADKQKAGAVNAGLFSAGATNDNPHPEIEFSHAVTDGSDEAIDKMLELIWQKYDGNADGKLHFNEAKAYIKRYLADEMDMANAASDTIDETWLELDEDGVGHVTKDKMRTWLKGIWDLKQ